MSKVYILFIKKHRSVENYKPGYFPSYEIHYAPIQGKVAELNPGECIDTYKSDLSEDETYVTYSLYRVSNIDGKAQEEFSESFEIPQCGH